MALSDPYQFIGPVDKTLGDRAKIAAQSTADLETSLNTIAATGLQARQTAAEADKARMDRLRVGEYFGKNILPEDPKREALLSGLHNIGLKKAEADIFKTVTGGQLDLAQSGVLPAPYPKEIPLTARSAASLDRPMELGMPIAAQAGAATVTKTGTEEAKETVKSARYNKEKGVFEEVTTVEGKTQRVQVKGRPVPESSKERYHDSAVTTLRNAGVTGRTIEILNETDTHVAIKITPPIDGKDTLTLKKGATFGAQ